MTQRSIRTGFFKGLRKLSKYETSLEAAFKQKKTYTVVDADTSTLTYVPDNVVVPVVATSPTILLPTDYFSEDKEVTVVNNDDATATVAGVSCLTAEKTVLTFDGSTWSKLYSVALT